MWIDEVPLIDHHCHAVVAGDLERPDFESHLREGPRGSFDSALGLAVRRWCAPLLDLPAHADPDDYLERRAEIGWREATSRLLGATGTMRWLLDTGFGGSDPTAFAELGGGRVHEIVRLEQVAEQVIAESSSAATLFDDIERALRDRLRTAVGLKSIVAYRCGLDFPLVTTAPKSAPHLENPQLQGWLVGLGARLGAEYNLPLQFHTGFGDPDLHLRHADPLLLTEFLRTTADTGLKVILLHCWPFHRNAAYLAHAFDHVRIDIGLAIPFVGQQSSAILAETLELAPFGSVLYASDGCGLAERHYLGARLWRTGLRKLLDEWLASDAITPADADRLVTALAHRNAEHTYRFPDAA
ncbi:amidohydrolase [Nocardia panacis]|uniref:Amidohydrolase n=1 Tax=Nocardia panacis TaxID=2340916 RepID=A0A3A4K194_9NOCA|nr:amidohydrolase family protein [Nocardia panacis]RJO69867.1 amidohydrolase [Nocardia panacis]